MKLYEIDQKILDCVDCETGEIVNLEKLNELQIEREAKIENIALWYKNLTAEAEALKAEKDKFAERERVAKNKAESVKQYLATILNGQKFKTTRCAITFRKSSKVIVDDVGKVPEKYLKFSEPKVDLQNIKTAIKSGEILDGARIEENINISIK